MSDIVVRSIFNTTVAKPSWKLKATSAAAHVVVIGAAFLVTFPVVRDIQTPAVEHVSLIAPVLPHPHVLIPAPPVRHIPKLVMPVAPPEKPAPVVIAKVIPPPVIPAPKVAAAPIVPAPQPRVQPTIEADARPVLPKPSPKIGTFEDLQAKSTPLPKQVVVGGFGDPRGVHPADNQKSEPVLLARVGAFDSPTGIGQSGGGGHLDSGSVHQAGFGNAGSGTGAQGTGTSTAVRTGNFGDSASGTAHTSGGAVRSTGFGDTVAGTPQHKSPVTSVAAFTPVEILFKPRPAYSAEARGMHLEGQVSLEVVFTASGAVKVVRIIKGLGHGLDEAALQAALQVRFKPATRAGAPVDTNATISITFELT